MPSTRFSDLVFTVIALTDDERFLKANPAAEAQGAPSDIISDASTSNSDSARTRLPIVGWPKVGSAFVFGRATSCDVVFPCRSLSRTHFRIYPNRLLGTWVIEALAKTVVNGRVLEGDVKSVQLRYSFPNRVKIGERTALLLEPTWLEPDVSCSPPVSTDSTIPSLDDLTTFSSDSQSSDVSVDSLLGNSPGGYQLLEQTIPGGLPIVQALDSGFLLVREQAPSETRARDAFVWANKLSDPHCLRAVDVQVLERSAFLLLQPPRYPQGDRFTLAEMVEENPIDSQSAFVLLKELLSTLQYLYELGVAHGTISPEHIVIEHLHPEKPSFFLTNIALAMKLESPALENAHQRDVEMVLETVRAARHDLELLFDPVASSIIDEKQKDMASRFVSAAEIRESLLDFTSGETVGYPFECKDFTRKFTLQFDRDGCFLRTELATVLCAYFTHNVSKARWVNSKLLEAESKRCPRHSAKERIHSRDAMKLFHRLGVKKSVDELKFSRRQTFGFTFKVMRHKHLNLWNASQLAAVKLPSDPFPLTETDVAVRVLGEPDTEGIYVDSATFRVLLTALDTRPLSPSIPWTAPSPHLDHPLLLADKHLLFGTAALDPLSQTVLYHSQTMSEHAVLAHCEHYPLSALSSALYHARAAEPRHPLISSPPTNGTRAQPPDMWHPTHAPKTTTLPNLSTLSLAHASPPAPAPPPPPPPKASFIASWLEQSRPSSRRRLRPEPSPSPSRESKRRRTPLVAPRMPSVGTSMVKSRFVQGRVKREEDSDEGEEEQRSVSEVEGTVGEVREESWVFRPVESVSGWGGSGGVGDEGKEVVEVEVVGTPTEADTVEERSSPAQRLSPTQEGSQVGEWSPTQENTPVEEYSPTEANTESEDQDGDRMEI